MKGIGDFAENLILNQVQSIKEGNELLPSAQDSGIKPAGRDISKVEVPDSFMQQILGESFHPQDTPATQEIPEIVWDQPAEPQAPQQITENPLEPQVSHSITEETAQELVPLLQEVKSLLKEMTTTGMLGANLGGPGNAQDDVPRADKKSGYITSKPSKTKNQILKQSIRNKLKKK